MKQKEAHGKSDLPFRERFGDTAPTLACEESPRSCDSESAIRDGVNVAALAAASTMI